MMRHTIQALSIAVLGLILVAVLSHGGRISPAWAYALAGIAFGAASLRLHWRTSRLPVAQALETVHEEVRLGRGGHRTAMVLDFCCVVCVLTAAVMAFRA